MNPHAPRPLTVGEPAPDFSCRSSNNDALFHFNTAGGRYLVISFFGSAAIEKNAGILRFITQDLRGYFDDVHCSFFGVSVDADDEARLQQMLPGIRYFWDFNKQVSQAFAVVTSVAEGGDISYASRSFVLDPMMRIMAVIPMQDADTHNATLAQWLQTLPPLNDYAGVPTQAPVLIVPRVFEPEFCRELIRMYETQGGQDSGFMRQKDGKTIGVIDYSVKRRSDFFFDEQEPFELLRQNIRARFGRRLIPEITKAFQFPVTRMERFVIACYESQVGGYFKPHRDNTTAATKHRRFACTLNLNAEDYEGGNLRFPEFGTQTYRAPTGGAVIFSCSLLHEATPVTRGTRYVFLPFLYGEEDAKLRAQNRQFLDDAPPIRNE